MTFRLLLFVCFLFLSFFLFFSARALAAAARNSSALRCRSQRGEGAAARVRSVAEVRRLRGVYASVHVSLFVRVCVCLDMCEVSTGRRRRLSSSSVILSLHSPYARVSSSFVLPPLLALSSTPSLPPILPPPSHPRSCDRRHSKKNTDPRCLVSTVGDPAVWEHRHQRGCFELNFNATEPICRTASATPTAASLDRRRMGLTLFAVAIL